MGDVVNLNRFRKRKQQQEAKRRADVNAIRRGRTKTERAEIRARRDKLDAKLDGVRREDDDEDESPT